MSVRYHPESNPAGNLLRPPKRWWQWVPKQQVDCGRCAWPRFDPQLPSSASSAAVTDGNGTSAAAAAATGPIYHRGDQVINKIPVALSMTPRLYGYVLQHTREHEVLRRLREATAAVSGSHMQITPEQGALLGLLVELIGARRVVEVGVFTGYSSCAMAMVGGVWELRGNYGGAGNSTGRFVSFGYWPCAHVWVKFPLFEFGGGVKGWE